MKIWPWSKIFQLSVANQALSINVNALLSKIAVLEQREKTDRKIIEELSIARKDLVRLAKARKKQLRDAGLQPVKLYDMDEDQMSVRTFVEEVAIAIKEFNQDGGIIE